VFNFGIFEVASALSSSVIAVASHPCGLCPNRPELEFEGGSIGLSTIICLKGNGNSVIILGAPLSTYVILTMHGEISKSHGASRNLRT